MNWSGFRRHFFTVEVFSPEILGCLQAIGRFRSPSTIETRVLVDVFSSAALYTQTQSLHKCRALKRPKNGKFVCFLVRYPSVRFLETVPFDPQIFIQVKVR